MNVLRERSRQFRLNNQDLVKKYNHKKYLKAKDQIAANRRVYYAKNKEAILAYKSSYRTANPVKFAVWSRNRKARVRNAPGSHTAEDIERLYTLQKGRCIYCPKKLGRSYHVDHYIAIINGGSNYPSNLQLLCRPCNLAKRAKDPISFANEIGRLL